MARKKLSLYNNKELDIIIAEYEAAKIENKLLYLDADILASIADYYANERKYKEAQEAIEYGLLLHEGSTELLIEQAYLYLDVHDVHQAKEVAETIAESYNFEVKILKAEILLNEGLIDEAKELLESIEDKKELDIIIDIVYLFIDMGYPDAAKEWLATGEQLYKDEEDYIALTADYLSSTNQIDTAIINYNQLIDEDPYNASYWVGLAKCRFITEDYEKAIEACDFALAADDTCGEAYMYRAHCYFYLDNAENAIEDYDKSIEHKIIPPEMGYMFIGMAYSNRDKWPEANNYYKKVYDIYKEKGEDNTLLLIDVLTNWAISCFNSGNREEAHNICKEAQDIFPNDSIVYLTEGKLYMEEKLEEKALEYFEKALNADAGAEIWYMIGDAYFESEEYPQAKKCYEEVYKIDPHHSNVAGKLSIICLMEDDEEGFFKYIEDCEGTYVENFIQAIIDRDNLTKEYRESYNDILQRIKKEK